MTLISQQQIGTGSLLPFFNNCRRNHKVLMRNLPPKEEWVLMVKMSEFQRKMYNMFMENLQLDAESCIGGTNPLKAFAVACKVSFCDQMFVAWICCASWSIPMYINNFCKLTPYEFFYLTINLWYIIMWSILIDTVLRTDPSVLKEVLGWRLRCHIPNLEWRRQCS